MRSLVLKSGEEKVINGRSYEDTGKIIGTRVCWRAEDGKGVIYMHIFLHRWGGLRSRMLVERWAGRGTGVPVF